MNEENKVSNLVYYETPLLEQINRLQQENTQLKQMVNSPSITFTTCPECGKNYSINYCREVYTLQQQLKDKDEKINKAIEYNNENIKRINEQTFGPFNAIPKNNVKIELEAVNKILETNKED